MRWKDNCEHSTIGIDDGEDGYTAICPNKFEQWFAENKYSELAGHYEHEYMHLLGFDHRISTEGAKMEREDLCIYG